VAERQRLPFIELGNWGGLNTKSNNESLQDTQLRDAKNVDFFKEYGSVAKIAGSSRVLASVYSESSVTKPISWVGFYKAADLNGEILRHVLVAAGTILARVESAGTLTTLTGSGKPITETRTSGLYHDSARFGDFLFISNQNPALIGSGDTMVKYNGSEILRWGVVAPGNAETTIETFSSISGWTTIDGGTWATDTTTTQDGTALKVTGVTATATLQKTIGAFVIDATVNEARIRLYVYIPRGQIDNIAQSDAVVIRVGSDTDVNNNYYQFNYNIGNLQEGWTRLDLDLNLEANDVGTGSPASISTTGSPSASNLRTFRIALSAKAGKTLDGVRFDRFIYLDAGVPTLAQGATGSVFSNAAVYKYVTTFVSKTGHESNAGPESDTLTLTLARAAISLTSIPTSTDPQVIARKIYRTVNGGNVFLFIDTIEDNTTTTYSDTTADTAIGSTQPPFAGDISDDNSPPPDAGIVKVWQRTVFLSGDPSSPFSVFFSADDEGESFPTLNVTNLDDRVTGMYETYSGLVVETETGKWQVTGSNPDFRFDKIINQIGCVGRRANGETRIQGWSIDRDGVRLYDLNEPVKISEVIRDKFSTEFDTENIELTHSAHSKSNNLITMFVPDSSGNYTSDNYIYQYPLDDISRGWWSQLSLPSSINVQHVVEIENSDGDFEFLAGATDGMLYKLFDPASKNWATATSTEAITTTLKTKWFRLGGLGAESEQATGRVQPRFVEIRKSGDNATWTCVVETANGDNQTTVTASKTISFAFGTNDSLLRMPVPSMQAGEYFRLTLTNSQASVSSTLSGIRVYFHVLPGQFAIEPGDLNASS
jgi:hypothetical protein